MTIPYSSSASRRGSSRWTSASWPVRRSHLLEIDLKPRDIMTRAAFENAMVIVIALGGSTNAVLHLLAMAHACGIEAHPRRLPGCLRPRPFIADLKPSGPGVMEDVHKIERHRRAQGSSERARLSTRDPPHTAHEVFSPEERDETHGFPFSSPRAMPINPFNSPDSSVPDRRARQFSLSIFVRLLGRTRSDTGSIPLLPLERTVPHERGSHR